MRRALSLIAAIALLLRTSAGIVQAPLESQEHLEPQPQEPKILQAQDSQESRRPQPNESQPQKPKILQAQDSQSQESPKTQPQRPKTLKVRASHESQISMVRNSIESQEESRSSPSSVMESEIIPLVRSGGTAIVPVRDALRCRLLRPRDGDVVPREKRGYDKMHQLGP